MIRPYFDLPILTEKEIIKKLKQRPLEDNSVISEIEGFFKKRRGYVIKLPKKGTPVILLLSGGLDTSVMWDILLKKYGFRVYPLFLRRGQIRMPLEEKSVDYFANFYAKSYPKLYQEPKKLTAIIPPLEIRWQITKYGNYPIIKKPLTWLGIPVYSSQLLDYAVQYAYFLEMNHRVKIRDIFCGFMGTDGEVFKYETLTALRTNMYNVCNLTNDFSWQFTSIALEKELGFLFDKNVLINWAKESHIPIHKSNSCIKFSYFHCGNCDFCKLRKSSFYNAGIIDRTIYLSEFRFQFSLKVINKILLIFETTKFLVRVWFELVKNFVYFLNHRY